MTTPAEKKIKKILKDFFKVNKQFKEVSEQTNCDAVLIFNKDNLKSYHIVIRSEINNPVPPPEPDDSYTLIFLKNSNPHDSRKATRGYVRRVTQKSCLRNYSQ